MSQERTIDEIDEQELSRTSWDKEREELLKTHLGWFVAYQNGKRIALESSLDRLVAAMDEKLGSPRKPCEFHEITERVPAERGPSPRLWPSRADK